MAQSGQLSVAPQTTHQRRDLRYVTNPATNPTKSAGITATRRRFTAYALHGSTRRRTLAHSLGAPGSFGTEREGWRWQVMEWTARSRRSPAGNRAPLGVRATDHPSAATSSGPR